MNEKLTKSINIGVIAIVLVFLALIVTPKISATETGNVPANNAEQITSVFPTTGVWVVVTESGKPLNNRSVKFIEPNNGEPEYVPREYKTNELGVIYLRLGTNLEFKIADTKTGIAKIINTGFVGPILINLDVTNYGTQNNDYPEGIFDLKVSVKDKHTNKPISSARVSIQSEDYTSTQRTFFTNDEGVTIIEYLPTGIYSFRISATNYVEQNVKNYFFGSTSNLNIDLRTANFEQNPLDGRTNHLISFEKCAVDKLKTIISKEAVTSRSEVKHYNVCEAKGFIDYHKKIYYMSKDESYISRVTLNNLDLTKYTQKQTPKAKLIFSTDSGNKCYEKELMLLKSVPEQGAYKFITTLIKEDLLETQKSDIGYLSANCGIGKIIKLSVEIYDVDNNPIFSIEDVSSITRIMIFSNKEEDMAIANQENNQRVTSDIIQRERTEISNIKEHQISRESEIFVNIGNEKRKVVSIENILEERNINPNKIISDIKLEETEYVFDVKEKKRLLGFIPFGEKIVEKRISAIREIRE